MHDGRLQAPLQAIAPARIVREDGPIPAIPAVAQFGDPWPVGQTLEQQADQVGGEGPTRRVGHVVLLPTRGGDGKWEPADMGVWKAFQMAEMRSERIDGRGVRHLVPVDLSGRLVDAARTSVYGLRADLAGSLAEQSVVAIDGPGGCRRDHQGCQLYSGR